MTCSGFLYISLAICASFYWIDASSISTCADHQRCLVFSESECRNGRRRVCLQQLSTNPGCPLNNGVFPTAYQSMCALTSEGSGVLFSDQTHACTEYVGGATAVFRADGGSAASTSLPGTGLQEINTGASFRAATCSAPGNRFCPTSTNPEVEWRFTVSSCNTGFGNCGCGEWSSFSSCNCATQSQTRSRTCLQNRLDCVTRESQSCSCNPGCTCSNTWSEWTACSSSCIGGTRQRFNFCSGGINCNTIVDTQPCGTVSCSGVIGGIGDCQCSAWVSSGCSVTCGTGTHVVSRTCSGFCGSNILTRFNAACDNPGVACSSGSRPAVVRCQSLPTKAQRQRCRDRAG